MSWAEVLAVFNFITWLLPIIVRSWMAWKYGNTNRATLSIEESRGIKQAIGKLNLRGKRLKIGSNSEGTGNSQEGSQ